MKKWAMLGRYIIVIVTILSLVTGGHKVFAESSTKEKQVNDSTYSSNAMIFNEGMSVKGPSKVEVGDKGSLDIKVDYEGIPFDGKYVFYYDDSLIKIDDQGNWEALKAGNVSITYGYLPSEKMLEDIKTHFGGTIPPQKSIALLFELSITEKQKSTEMAFNEGMILKGPSQVEVGDKGTFDIQVDYEGIPFDGKYVFYYDDSLIKIDDQGNWEALKAGKVNITYGYLPSEKMLEDIKTHFGGTIPPQKSIALLFELSITEKQKSTEMVFNEGMKLSGPSNVEVGDKGTFDIQVDYENIPFDGKYVFYYDDSLIKIDDQGNWEALKAGKVDITYGYLPSEKMLEAIKKHFGGEIPPQKAIALIHEMVISEKQKITPMVFNEGMSLKGPTNVEVGDKGTFDIQVNYEGIPFDGKYVFYYDNSLIKIDDQGNWEALKAGKVDITYGYLPSEKMLENLTTHFGGEIPPQKDISKVHQMIISEKVVQQLETTQTASTKKQLPRTGEQQKTNYQYLGVFITGLALWFVKRQRQQSK